jgi:hypothetical protein
LSTYYILQMLTNFTQKNSLKYECVNCDFKCSNKNDYNRHNLTLKHKMLTNVGNKNSKNLEKFICECGKEYNHRQSLSLHKKKCTKNKKEDEKELQIITPELIINIIQQNQEFKDLLMEQNKLMLEISKNSNITTNNNNNSHNKTFNLQLYLNETCKDAMNIMDFVDSIKFQLSDLESIGELGYINGLSKVIIRNLKALDENMRPVHCSDMKREKIYIKDADKWEKEGPDNKILKNAIKYIAHKNVKMIPAFREKYPDCIYSDSRKSDQYNRLIIEAMGGDGNDENEKSNKIIKKIAKEILIDK